MNTCAPELYGDRSSCVDSTDRMFSGIYKSGVTPLCKERKQIAKG